ncbi:MAG: hypothetical protein KA369_00555 [Spirochaetes bacterium]|nr:hypothetical protein [Spirochaetota bacterium]
MTSKQGTQPNRPLHDEYPPIHSKNSKSCLKNREISPDGTSSRAQLESISRYYNYLGATKDDPSPHKDVNGCFAVRLALFLIETISSRRYALDDEGCLGGDFYRHCMKSDRDLAMEINDPDLLIIYIKQCLRMMDSCGILLRDGSFARISAPEASAATIFHRLFNSFWNSTPWEDLFPSDTESARELNAVRAILKDLLLRRHASVSIGTLANEFFEMTGFSSRNNLFMISFLDFYFFTWLKHFGMIRYSGGKDHAPVRITVTDLGRNSLKTF